MRRRPAAGGSVASLASLASLVLVAVVVAVGGAAMAACGKTSSGSSGSGSDHASLPGAGWYRVEIGRRQGSPVPFFMQIPAHGDDVVIVSGPSRVHAKVTARAPKIVVAFDVLHTYLEGTPNAKGVLEGTWQVRSQTWGNSSLSFTAEPVSGPDPALRFPAKAGGPDPTGIWKVTLTKPSDVCKLVVARGTGANEVTGTLSFPTGNLVFVTGNQDGKTLRMSSFDGASPYLLVVTLDDGGATLTGTFTAGQTLDWNEQVSGARTADFELASRARLASARPKLALAALARPPYAGKPTIVELGGSWCPACGNAVPVMRRLREQYAAQGLQVLRLDYEFTDDHNYNVLASDQFKAKYQIPWEVIAVDGDALPPELGAADGSGFPIAIFVARDGGIEGFHSGFPPEEWGEPHRKAVADFERLAAKIAAEPGR